MSNKWNEAKAKSYSEAFTNLLCEKFFQSQSKISGAEILKFTEVKQLNMLIVRELYEKWQQETAKVRSPYFDFENVEVQKAFQEFQNILSRYISVGKEQFSDLLQKAVYDTLELHMNTKGYFEQLMRGLPSFKLTEDWLKVNGKYYISHSWILAELLSRKGGLPVVYANQAIEWVREIVEEHNPNMPNQDLEQLNQILSINWNESSPRATSFFDEALEIPLPHVPKVERSSPAKEEIKEQYVAPVSAKQHEPVQEPQPEVNRIAETGAVAIAAKTEIATEKKVKEPRSLNDKLLGSQATLNEKIIKEARVSLSDNHSKGKIESIRSSISLNQRFLFINNLFGGNVQAFTGALDEIEAKVNFGEAKETMIKKYLPTYKWDITSPEAEEFFEILKRRFS